MNFLQLTQALRNRCSGMGGVDGQPTSVVGQVGDMARLVDWTRDAWIDLQASRPDWLFMQAEFTGTVTAGTLASLPAAFSITNLADWRRDTLRAYPVSQGLSGDTYLVEWDYGLFRDVYRFGVQVAGMANSFAVRPRDQAILLGSIPSTDTVVYGEYQRSPQMLAADADVPTGLPEWAHMAIVYLAMTKYAGNWAAPEVMVDAQNQMESIMSRLVLDWTPKIGNAEPLA